MPSYRPSARARIQIRIDEGKDTGELETTVEQSPPDFGFGIPSVSAASVSLAGLKNFSNAANLEQLKGNISTEDYEKQKKLIDKNRNNLNNLAFNQGKFDGVKEKEDDFTVIFSVLPDDVRISRNEQDVDTLSMTMRFEDFPIDPRIIRAGFVAVAIGDVSAQDFRDGVINSKKREDGSLVSNVKYEASDEGNLGSQVRFTGIITEYSVSFDESGNFVTLECCDNSILLRSISLTEKYRIDLTQPLAKGVSLLIDKFSSVRGYKVVFEDGTKGDGPIPIDVMSKTAVARRTMTGLGKKGKARKQTQDVNLFDHIYEVCQRLGYSVYVRNFTIQIQQPANVYADASRLKTMVYGRNLTNLGFSRKLEGVKTQTIEIRSPDMTSGKVNWARYPVLNNEPKSGILGETDPVNTRPNAVTPAGTAEDKVLVFTVPSISDLPTLERVAKNVYQQIGRQEIEGSWTTENLSSFRSESPDDLLDLQPGDPIAIYKASGTESPTTSPLVKNGLPAVGSGFDSNSEKNGIQDTVQKLANLSYQQRVQFLVKQGLSLSIAFKLAKAEELVQLTQIFRVNYVNINFSQDGGISIDASFINFIEVRDLDPENVEQDFSFDTQQKFIDAAIAATILV